MRGPTIKQGTSCQKGIILAEIAPLPESAAELATEVPEAAVVPEMVPDPAEDRMAERVVELLDEASVDVMVRFEAELMTESVALVVGVYGMVILEG